MLKALLPLFGGPLTTLVRYGITAGGAALIAKGVPSGVVENAGAAIMAGLPAVIGMFSATTTARAAQLVKSDSVEAIQTTAGVITKPEQAFDWTARD